ncbi:HNH endonuclease signature motif containing protein [Georgenia sp. SYP-B2076]|uniref:HNH endonuclease signature motif containing protein n=1 Tax=Georgenia sp. SYP-B2076 TaxID=2495881 RepID=UPI0013DF2783|nr:HNH endonuclease signature motif containing protein [Georgenia sp. SYP-B2076]
MSLTEETGDPAAALAAGLATMQDVLAQLHTIDLHAVPGPAVLAALDGIEQVRRKTESLSARTLATIEADGMWALDGARSMAAWYRARTGKHRASAAREVKQARALRDHLPATAKALAAGEISTDHAAAMVKLTTDTEARRDRLVDPEVGEGFLLEHAKKLDASDFTLAAQEWGTRADPDAADRAYQEDTLHEEFTLAETTDGYVPSGWLSTSSGKLLLTALAARTGTPAKTDTRTPAQRRANALVGLAHLALDSGTLRPGARIRPHLSITVPFDTLQRLVAAAGRAHRPGCRLVGTYPGAAFGLPLDLARTTDLGGERANGQPGPEPAGEGSKGCTCPELSDTIIDAGIDAAAMVGVEPATFEDGAPLSPALLARLACGSQMHRVIFGPDSEILDAGREQRLFTAAQTRAIIARDKRCQYPNCHAPPGEGEIHHSIAWWAQFGSTNINLGVLLCWYHHDWVHAHAITIERRHGQWVFIRQDGSVIGDTALAA